MKKRKMEIRRIGGPQNTRNNQRGERERTRRG